MEPVMQNSCLSILVQATGHHHVQKQFEHLLCSAWLRGSSALPAWTLLSSNFVSWCRSTALRLLLKVPFKTSCCLCIANSSTNLSRMLINSAKQMQSRKKDRSDNNAHAASALMTAKTSLLLSSVRTKSAAKISVSMIFRLKFVFNAHKRSDHSS
jgi:hypothetical protein